MNENIANLFAAYRIDTIGWFIEHDQFRIVDERLRNSEPLHHAFRILAHFRLAPIAHADQMQCLIDTLR
jgi:hypothetical protein